MGNRLKCDVGPQNRRKMVSTKHCCWGKCKTDSRYREKWPKSLKEVEESGKKVTEANITRNTYICALHWSGEKGPSEEFPDQLKANFSPAQASHASLKRKVPSSRENL